MFLPCVFPVTVFVKEKNVFSNLDLFNFLLISLTALLSALMIQDREIRSIVLEPVQQLHYIYHRMVRVGRDLSAFLSH